MFTDFQRSLERANLAPNTTAAYIADLTRIAGFGLDLASASTSDLESALDTLTEQGVAAASRNRAVAALRKFYGFLVAHGARADNPAAPLGYAATHTALPVSLNGSDIALMLEAAATSTKFYRKRNIAIVSLLAGSGLRRNELATLEVSDIDLEAGAVLVRQGKGRKQRRIPIWGEQVDAIRDHIEALRQTARQVRDLPAHQETGEAGRTVRQDLAAHTPTRLRYRRTRRRDGYNLAQERARAQFHRHHRTLRASRCRHPQSERTV